MRALKRERNGSVSSRIRRDEKKRSCPDEKICAGKEYDALWKRYIA